MRMIHKPLLLMSLWLAVFALSAASQGSENNTQMPARTAVATFAGGCFWCMEPPFDKLDGVISTISGYTDGHKKNPTYKQVSAGTTGHTEAVQITYNPDKVSFDALLAVYWKNIDPTVKDRQFCDRGSQYRSGIYYHSEQQKKSALASKQRLLESKQLGDASIYTQIKAATQFTPAEGYHQDYYLKNPIRYKYYRRGCGRDKRLQKLWGKS